MNTYLHRELVKEPPLVYIIVLNYNNWEDTIECLESLLKLEYDNYKIVVVDNASPNQSMEKIISWAEGEISVEKTNDNSLKNLSYPNISKPVEYTLYKQAELVMLDIKADRANLVFIQADNNNGYAAGNNIGINYIKGIGNFEYIWVLNNDTVVAKDSLKKFVEGALMLNQQNPQTHIFGGKLLLYENPKTLQAVGGTYNKWLGTTKQIGFGEQDTGQFENYQYDKDKWCVVGASILLSRSFLAKVGLMNEDLFLYYEEVDWAIRSRLKGIGAGFIPEVRVFHKIGKSINGNENKKSKFSDYYHIRNHLLISKKYYPQLFFFVRIFVFGGTIIKRVLRGQFDRIPMILNIVKSTK